jgi:hypothetical protein
LRIGVKIIDFLRYSSFAIASTDQKKERRQTGKLAPREPINKLVHAAMDGKEKAFDKLADQILHRKFCFSDNYIHLQPLPSEK